MKRKKVVREGLIKTEAQFIDFCDHYSKHIRVKTIAKVLYREAVKNYGSPFWVQEDLHDFEFTEVDMDKLAKFEAANNKEL